VIIGEIHEPAPYCGAGAAGIEPPAETLPIMEACATPTYNTLDFLEADELFGRMSLFSLETLGR
jgi:hypothetical protein